ncbi:Mfsd13a [Phodopus roborovskii]|uniref:Mfsd13a protein n=1 Tax=Phodopus roborovskii TaxID=109678 RepID=A0AAU9ZWR8_PHORO|nr:Mfsd13a [Phodopus roborovskii]
MGLDWPQAWLLGLPTAVVYGSLALFISILHNVFLLYYVDTFVSVYKINKVSFWIGETVFLLWNSFNDPLFGWLSDRQFLSSQPRSGAGLSSRDVVLTRVRALSWHGPLLALSFLAFWVPWAPAGLQFLLCLCLYDGFLTLVDLHHHALLADLALSAHDRTHLNFYCSLFSAAGSMSVFASYAFWNKEDFSSFRAFCVVLAAGSGLGFLAATQLLRRRIEATRRDRGCSALVVDGSVCEELLVGGEEAGSISLGQYLRQLARHQNFLWFVGMDLVQASPMLPLISTTCTSCPCAGAGESMPWCGGSSCSSWASASSCYWLARTALACFAASLPGRPRPRPSPTRCVHALHSAPLSTGSNRVFTEGTCKLLTLVVTDLVDEDMVLNHRKQAASALLFGMVALVTKPGQTFAPLLGTWLLCFYTGEAPCPTSSGAVREAEGLCLGLRCCPGIITLVGSLLHFFLN